MDLPEMTGLQRHVDSLTEERRLRNQIFADVSERDYLDRVALEAMKCYLASNDYVGAIDELASDSHALARAMLKERSREVGE
jgi:hypothetical protein